MPRDTENAKRLKREWYLRNKELTISRAKSWSESNPEKRADILAKNREVNADARTAYNRDWSYKHSDKR